MHVTFSDAGGISNPRRGATVHALQDNAGAARPGRRPRARQARPVPAVRRHAHQVR